MYDIKDIISKYSGEEIAIIGNGPSSKAPDGLPYDFSGAYKHIWTVNGGKMFHPTACLEFMMDDFMGPALHVAGVEDDIKEKYFKNIDIPVITTTKYEGYDCLVEYPLKEVIDFFGTAYFGETLSYMVAFAILCNVKRIDFHGTDYHGCKPAERASTEHWCAWAKSKGIQIKTNPQSHFLKTQLDGVNNHIPFFYGYIPETFPFDYRMNEHSEFQILIGGKDRAEKRRDAIIKFQNEKAYGKRTEESKAS